MLQNKFEWAINEYIWIGRSAQKRDNISGGSEEKKAATYNPGQDLPPLIKVPTIRIRMAESAKIHNAYYWRNILKVQI
jgi:hypothetical protein